MCRHGIDDDFESRRGRGTGVMCWSGRSGHCRRTWRQVQLVPTEPAQRVHRQDTGDEGEDDDQKSPRHRNGAAGFRSPPVHGASIRTAIGYLGGVWMLDAYLGRPNQANTWRAV